MPVDCKVLSPTWVCLQRHFDWEGMCKFAWMKGLNCLWCCTWSNQINYYRTVRLMSLCIMISKSISPHLWLYFVSSRGHRMFGIKKMIVAFFNLGSSLKAFNIRLKNSWKSLVLSINIRKYYLHSLWNEFPYFQSINSLNSIVYEQIPHKRRPNITVFVLPWQ